MRIVVIGGDAAGMSAAHSALRAAKAAGREARIVVLETTGDTSYSACGIPYWIAGEVASGDDLVARTADEHRAAGIDLRLHARATAVDTTARTVTYRQDETTHTIEYDELVLATGAHPVVPAWARTPAGALVAGVHPVKNLDDGALWTELLAGPARRAVIVGGGYIGIEMAEALLHRGLSVTLLTRSRVMGSLDPDLGELIERALVEAGVDVRTDTTVTRLTSVDGAVTSAVTTDGDEVEADVVVLALGVVPATELGEAAGVPVGIARGYLPDDQGRVAPHVWAAGDCCESQHRMTGERDFVALGTHANKQGRVVGDALFGGSRAFHGVLGTAITRFAAGGRVTEIARTGLSTRQAVDAGHDVAVLATESSTVSGYMPGAETMVTKVIADRRTRALLGVQIVGGPGAGKRIDAAAAALWGRMSVDDLAEMDLSYAPPFATVWDALQIAARRLAERI
ncbi:NADPH-dependent L-lysine N(6)-monooxygenase [Nocardioides sp. BGMRC 2183]|nr:NADPH-dependent L-lysine N(6)-monooxygenase [Nocardioides sp. BGMRC 2183]